MNKIRLFHNQKQFWFKRKKDILWEILDHCDILRNPKYMDPQEF